MNFQRLVIVFALFTGAALAQNPAPLLVDVDWLSGHLKDKDLVLLHVGNKKDYDAAHIPGARFITMQDVARPMNHATMPDTEMMLELPSAEDLRTKAASFGISDDSHIVIYVGAEAAFASATRIVFSLDYLGLGGRTSVLNGGMIAWTREGKPVTTAAPQVTAGKLTARPTNNLVADAAFVKSVPQHPNQKLVDARAAVFYKGIEPTYNKSGHIPGAVNLPYTEIIDNKLIVDRDRVAELFRNAGIKQGDTVVVYCHIGQQATAVIFGARLLGYPVLLYDGAFQDWSVNNRGPVEK
jgi:thiosulfate/3-mercaptopyruvate sulfurtransferase